MPSQRGRRCGRSERRSAGCRGTPARRSPWRLQAVAEANRAGELEALARAYTALDGSYQMLGQPERAVNEPMALEI